MGGDEGGYPILDTVWRPTGDVDENAQDLLDVAGSPFSAGAEQAVVRGSNKPAENFADIRLAARQVREFHTRCIAGLSQNARELLSDDAVVGGGNSTATRIWGTTALWWAIHRCDTRLRLAIRRSETPRAASNLRKDVREGRLLDVRSGDIKPDAL